MAFTEAPAPIVPYYPPIEIAPDTFVVQATQGEGVAPVAVHLNTMVIRGSEPIIVDTGVPALRDRYLDDMWSLVDPDDVRWVFLSHDDVDHYGNLGPIMEACPNATLLTSWFQWERLGNLPDIAPNRMRWLEPNDTFEANGRTYATVRPPLYDSPTTRGLFDTATGVYWASDCFATMVPHALGDVAELSADEWIGACYAQSQQLSPWLSMVDPSLFLASVERVARLGITTIASCHSPTITGPNVDRAFQMLRDVVDVPPIAVPGQELLDMIIAMGESDLAVPA
ncbi:MAG TPA: MBL fold metallo-hydrolase [Ilumatobacter sp.]|nr:MBL fold metallo-hydrolase [Ilumatobacter sp.]